MSVDLYEPCPACGPGSGDGPVDRVGACVGCGGRRFVPVGLTIGQVEQLARIATDCGRAFLGDSGANGPERYTVMVGGVVRRFDSVTAAVEALCAAYDPFRRED